MAALTDKEQDGER